MRKDRLEKEKGKRIQRFSRQVNKTVGTAHPGQRMRKTSWFKERSCKEVRKESGALNVKAPGWP